MNAAGSKPEKLEEKRRAQNARTTQTGAASACSLHGLDDVGHVQVAAWVTFLHGRAGVRSCEVAKSPKRTTEGLLHGSRGGLDGGHALRAPAGGATA